MRLAVALFVLVAIAALAPVRSYDFFWHLATGRWIVEHRALPQVDPFALASARTEWINGEWLFQVAAYAIGNLTAIAIARALFVAVLFALVFRFAARETDERIALLLTTLAFAGAYDRLDARPSTIAALFVVLAIRWRENLVLYALLTIVWINVHPSALLAPAIALIATRRVVPPLVSAIALLVNPYGWRAIAAPISLTRLASSGEFVNAEWLPSMPQTFPLLYATLVMAVVVFVTAREREPWRIVLFAMVALLAVRHVRNQGLYFAAFPLLVAPMVRREVAHRLMYVAAAVPLAYVLLHGDYSVGVDAKRFPVRAVARLQETRLRGNVYNPDQLGGYLIWSFYPERRTLTDGRNELHRAYIAEYARARVDSRAWVALLRKYRIDLAVEEYRPPLDVLDYATRKQTKMPASLAYFPRAQWALIAYDDAAMVFARRAAFDAGELSKWEIRGEAPDGGVVPDGGGRNR